MTQGDEVKEDRTREYVVLGPELLQQRNTEDEISLFGLWDILSRKRNLFLGVLAVAIATSLAIALLMPPVYQASIHFRAPYNSDIESLNIPNFSSGYTAEDVFIEFQDIFNSRDNLWKFFADKQLYRTYLKEKNLEDSNIKKAFEKYFLKNLTMHKSKIKGENSKFIHATLQWETSAEAAALLNEYSQLILALTNRQYADELQSKLTLEKDRVQEQIALLRASELRLKKNRLAELEENITIAKELGFKRSKGLEEITTPEVSVSVMEVQPLYYQGYEVLESEKRALLARKDHDPFTTGLEDKLKRLDYLNSIKITENNMPTVQVIQEAAASNEPIKPKKKHIMIIGIMLGMLMGLLAAFFSEFREKIRSRASSL